MTGFGAGTRLDPLQLSLRYGHHMMEKHGYATQALPYQEPKSNGQGQENLSGHVSKHDRHSMAGNNRHSMAGDNRHSMVGDNRHSMTGNNRHSMAGNNRHSMAGDNRQSRGVDRQSGLHSGQPSIEKTSPPGRLYPDINTMSYR